MYTSLVQNKGLGEHIKGTKGVVIIKRQKEVKQALDPPQISIFLATIATERKNIILPSTTSIIYLEYI
jgi:hypothetical protein